MAMKILLLLIAFSALPEAYSSTDALSDQIFLSTTSSPSTLNTQQNDAAENKTWLHSLSELGEKERATWMRLRENLRNNFGEILGVTMEKNNFSKVPPNIFMYSRELKIIELCENGMNITDLPHGLFSNFSYLERVTLQNIGLQRLTKGLFYKSYRLKEINLSDNFLKELPLKLLRDAHELTIFNISSNHLTTLPSGIFIPATRLTKLDLSKNYITSLNNSKLFIGLQNLEMLNIEDNGLKFIHANAFISLLNLKVAKFARNHLNLSTGLPRDQSGNSASPFRYCLKLEKLHLSNNDISEIYSDWLVDLVLLRELDLSYNNFSHVKSKYLQFNASHLQVYLENNGIKPEI